MLTPLGVMILKNSVESCQVSGDYIFDTVVEIVLYTTVASVLHEPALSIHWRGSNTVPLTIGINWPHHQKRLTKEEKSASSETQNVTAAP